MTFCNPRFSCQTAEHVSGLSRGRSAGMERSVPVGGAIVKSGHRNTASVQSESDGLRRAPREFNARETGNEERGCEHLWYGV